MPHVLFSCLLFRKTCVTILSSAHRAFGLAAPICFEAAGCWPLTAGEGSHGKPGPSAWARRISQEISNQFFENQFPDFANLKRFAGIALRGVSTNARMFVSVGIKER